MLSELCHNNNMSGADQTGESPVDRLSRQQYEHDPSNLLFRREVHKFAPQPIDYYLEGFKKVGELGPITITDIIGDIGCFDGEAFIDAALAYGVEAQLIGIDAYAQAYRDRLLQKGPRDARFAFLQNRAEEIHLPDNAFKVMFAKDVLHAVGNIPLALHEMRRVTVPGGIILIVVNGKRNMVKKHENEPEIARIATEILGYKVEPPLVSSEVISTENAPATLESEGLEIIDSMGRIQPLVITRQRYPVYADAILTSVSYTPGIVDAVKRDAWRQGIDAVVKPKVDAEISAMEAEFIAKAISAEAFFTEWEDKRLFVCRNIK